MANRPPGGPRFQIPTVARPAPPQPRPRPPLASAAVPRTPYRPPPPSPPPPAPQIPTINGVTTSNSSPKSTVLNPDYVAPSPSRGDVPNAISHNVNVVQTSPDDGKSNIAPPPSPFKLPPPLLATTTTTTTQDNHDQPNSLLTCMEGTKHKNEMNPAPENSIRHQPQQQQQHYYTRIEKGNPELNKEKGGTLKKQSSSSIVTLAGENKGATMEFGKNHKNNRGNSTDRNNNGGGHGTNKKGATDHGYMINSNVQGVNNSIVYGSSYAHNDPGVHLKVLRKTN